MQCEEKAGHPCSGINSPFCDFLSPRIPGTPKPFTVSAGKKGRKRGLESIQSGLQSGLNNGVSLEKRKYSWITHISSQAFFDYGAQVSTHPEKNKRSAKKVYSGQWSGFLSAESLWIFEGKAQTPLGCQVRESCEIHPLRFGPEEPNFFWGPGKLTKSQELGSASV